MQSVIDTAKFSLILPFLVGVCFVVNVATGGALSAFGIVPRHLDHAVGILTAPFVHREISHFLSNILPLIVFSFLLAQHGVRRYVVVVSILFVGVGAGVWLIGRPSNHIGASGLIYGLFGYLLCHGIYERSAKALAISIFVFVFYFSMAITAFRLSSTDSWESHILGFIVGVLAAKRGGVTAGDSVVQQE